MAPTTAIQHYHLGIFEVHAVWHATGRGQVAEDRNESDVHTGRTAHS
jgi:hypothetical protein